MELENLPLSKSLVRVLKVLLRYGEINVTKLCKEADVSTRQLYNVLDKLQQYNIISIKKYSRLRIIKLNRDNKYIKLLTMLCLILNVVSFLV